MLKGFAITPVVLGRIAIGTIIENKGKKLPMKLDHMLITSNIQKDGSWIMHPAAEKLEREQKGKIRSIPVRIMFDNPSLNFRAEYSAFNDKGRLICSGDGEKARRRDPQAESGTIECSCPGSDLCSFGAANRCKPFGRLIVALEDGWEQDPLSGFMFRTTSFNSIRALTARLEYLAGATGNKMAGMPCNLVMRAKSTSASMRRPVYYLDLEPRNGLLNAMAEAATKRAEMEKAGFDRKGLEEAVARGYGRSAFVEALEDEQEVATEFYNPEFVDPETGEIFRSGEPPVQADSNQAGNSAAAPERLATDCLPRRKEAGQQQPVKQYASMTDEELWAEVDEKVVESLKKAIARVPNIQDETSANGARVWNANRFGEGTAAMHLIERALTKQVAQIKGLSMEDARKSA